MPHTPKGEGFDFHDKICIAHAVFACIAALITAPAALLIARYFRSRAWWFKAHLILQSLTVGCVFILFVLSTVAVSSGGHGTQFTGLKKDPHHDLGLSIFILLFMEAIFGIAAHYTSSKQSTTYGAFPTIRAKKSLLRHLHLWYGIVVAGALYAAIKSGITEWNEVSDSGTTVPNSVVTIYWVIFSLEITAYVVGWLLEAFHGKRDLSETEDLTEEKARTPSI